MKLLGLMLGVALCTISSSYAMDERDKPDEKNAGTVVWSANAPSSSGRMFYFDEDPLEDDEDFQSYEDFREGVVGFDSESSDDSDGEIIPSQQKLQYTIQEQKRKEELIQEIIQGIIREQKKNEEIIQEFIQEKQKIKAQIRESIYTSIDKKVF